MGEKMAISFQKRRLKFTFTLSTGAFSDGTDTRIIENAKAHITHENLANIAAALPEVSFRIWGLSYDVLKRLSFTQAQSMTINQQNKVKIEVGEDSGESWFVLFEGNIIGAYVDFNQMPNVPLMARAVTAYSSLVDVAKPLTYKNKTPLSQIAEAIISQMKDFSFIDGGLQGEGVGTFQGSPMVKLREFCNNYQLVYIIDEKNITIMPYGKANPHRANAYVLSATTGLVGYPTLTDLGASVRMLYHPSIRSGDKIILKSEINEMIERNRPPTTKETIEGEWYICKMFASLSSETPNGDWFLDLDLLQEAGIY